jgi:dihydrofolate reductase
MNINLIVAIDEKNGIGKNNLLPWHLPADLKHFKTITTGHPIIMGRKTFDSIGKALPNRRNIVISRQSGLVIPGAELCSSLNDAIELCKDEKDVFFPVINLNEWTEQEKILHEPDEKNLYSYSFIKYKKA